MSDSLPSGPVIIMLGSNDGERMDYLSKAKYLLKKNAGRITAESSVYETAAWGKMDQPDYLNQVVVMETLLSPVFLLRQLLGIEQLLGRNRGEKWAIRTIDLDILFYSNEVIHEENLEIPHPRISERKFTLMPLVELMPRFIHPVNFMSMDELAAKCTDTLMVRKISLPAAGDPSS